MCRRRVDMAPRLPLGLDCEHKRAEIDEMLTLLLHLLSDDTEHVDPLE